ncbi:hypothetical protein Slin15195_G039480 [Septoria linicola]|uniref:Uncharacterized protein n=1 Tax=Septoria linicola TaxID=215465 RepID=A0A9Q9AJS1_9PEZI|nr:hypothetical protein Slin14017_G120900 [Septoria linicola]USW50629.1 hypothetical protein Slin15195_G039480 [Septoria linicola]
MSRQTKLTVTILITFLALLLGLQLKEPDSILMRYLSTNNAASKLLINFPQARRAFPPFASSCSTTTTRMSSTSESTADPELRDVNGHPLGLPEPPAEGKATKLDMSSGSDTVKLDHLGPLVVNKDGSLSRISNWEQMTEQERKSTLRILGKRNQLRTEKLKKEEEEQKA